MLVSLEALAMAGASYVECAMDIEEWERNDMEQNPPPHLLADEEEEEEKEEGNGSTAEGKGFMTRGRNVYGLPTTKHLLHNHNTKEYGVTFTNHQEKLNRTMETRRPESTRSIKIMATTIATLCMIMIVCHNRSRTARDIDSSPRRQQHHELRY